MAVAGRERETQNAVEKHNTGYSHSQGYSRTRLFPQSRPLPRILNPAKICDTSRSIRSTPPLRLSFTLSRSQQQPSSHYPLHSSATIPTTPILHNHIPHRPPPRHVDTHNAIGHERSRGLEPPRTSRLFVSRWRVSFPRSTSMHSLKRRDGYACARA